MAEQEESQCVEGLGTIGRERESYHSYLYDTRTTTTMKILVPEHLECVNILFHGTRAVKKVEF